MLHVRVQSSHRRKVVVGENITKDLITPDAEKKKLLSPSDACLRRFNDLPCTNANFEIWGSGDVSLVEELAVRSFAEPGLQKESIDA